jgi:glycosyltransferase involved in cell wall biosynthesis
LKSDYPLISVIIPALNEEKLISSTLSQFTPQLKQKYNIEVIVSDGGSTDSTLKFISETADKIIEAQPGKKQNIPIGRNIGASQASGEYYYFVNADTRFQDTDSFFQKTIIALTDSKISALTCRIRVFPDEEKFKDKLFHFCYNNYVFILNKLGIGMGRGECQIVRKSIFEKVHGYNESIPAGEDFDLYRRIRKIGKIKYLRDVTVYESPRRYRKFGYAKVFWNWTENSISVFLRSKAISGNWEAVR